MAEATDVTALLDELHQLQRLQRRLEPLALAAVLIHAWALVEALRARDGYATAALTAVVAAFLLVWSYRERSRSRRLQAELDPWLD